MDDPIIVDLTIREEKLRERLRQLGTQIRELEAQLNHARTEAVKIGGQLELLQDLQRDGDGR